MTLRHLPLSIAEAARALLIWGYALGVAAALLVIVVFAASLARA